MKNEQEKVKKLMQEELEREAEKIRAEVEADESLRNLPFPDGMDGELQKKIEEYEKNKAAVEMLSEEDQEALRLGRELQMLNVKENEAEDKSENGENGSAGRTGKTVRFRRKKRTYVLLAFVAILVLAMGMTAIGGQPFVSMIREQILGDRNMVQIDSDNSEGDETIVNSGVDEEELAYQQIKDEFGFEPVRLETLPDGAKFENIIFTDDKQEVLLIYDISGKILEYRIYPNFRNKSIGYDIEDEMIDEYTLTVSQVPIFVQIYQIAGLNQNQYVAQFNYNGTFYLVNYISDREVIDEILNNLKFF